MNDEKFSPQESLGVIKAMIDRAKNQFSENGHLYLLWGWAVLICSLAQFILMHYVQYEKHYLVWISMWLVFIYQFFYLRKEQRQKRVRTYTDDIVGFVWLVFIILMFLFGFLFGVILGDKYYSFINPGFLALYGMPTFLSGIILRFRPLVIGGVSCWILSVAAPFIHPEYQLLLLPVAMIAAWITPGYLLQRKYKQQNA